MASVGEVNTTSMFPDFDQPRLADLAKNSSELPKLM